MSAVGSMDRETAIRLLGSAEKLDELAGWAIKKAGDGYDVADVEREASKAQPRTASPSSIDERFVQM